MGYSAIAVVGIFMFTAALGFQITQDTIAPSFRGFQNKFENRWIRDINKLRTDIRITNASTNWWDQQWQYRKLITINSSQVSNDLINFTVLIDTTDTGIRDHAQSNGNDIIFVNNNGTIQYNHEIEDYDNSIGRLIAWVKIPLIYASEDTLLYLYYGNSGAINQENPTDTWDKNYISVWHFNNDSLSDSTSSGYDGTNSGTTYASSCKIAGGREYNGNDRIDITNFAHLPTELTAEAWVFRDNNDNQAFIRLFTEGPDWNDNDWCIYWRTNTGQMRFIINSNDFRTGGSINKQNEWFHISITFNSGDALLFHNGAIEADWTGLYNNTINNNYQDLTLGNQNNGGRPWIGKLDEIRISNISRSKEWIETSYNNMNSPITFTDVGAEQSILTNKIDVSIIITNNGKTTFETEGFTILFNGKAADITCPKTYLSPDHNLTCTVSGILTGTNRIKIISAEGISNYYIYEN